MNRHLLPVLIGVVLGALLGYFGKCNSGTCPLTATWWRGALYGGFMGLLFSIIGVASDSVWAIAAGTARYWLTSSLGRLAAVRAGGGVALTGLGVYMTYEAFR